MHRSGIGAPCDGDTVLAVHNTTDASLDVYFRDAKGKTKQFIGNAPIGDSELPLPPLAPSLTSEFEFVRHEVQRMPGLPSDVSERHQLVCRRG